MSVHCIRSVFGAHSHTEHNAGVFIQSIVVWLAVLLFLGEFKGKLLLVSVWVDGFGFISKRQNG